MLSEIVVIITNSLSAALPILSTIIAGLVLYAKQDFDRVQNMRRAYLAELEAVDLPTYAKLGDQKIPVPYNSRLVPTTVYENNSSNIGKLTSGEVESLVNFYSLAKNPEHLKDVMVEFEHHVEDPRWDLTHLEEKKDLAIKNLKNGLDTKFRQYIWEKLF